MKPIPTKERLPRCFFEDIYDETNESDEVWWWSNKREAWFLGEPILMDFTDPNTWLEWTHWMTKENIIFPSMEEGPSQEETEDLVDWTNNLQNEGE